MWGRPPVDPTDNVRHEMAAAVQRNDDLRQLEAAHVRELDAMRDAHAHELRRAEAARLDAIRAVDNNAVQRAAEVAAEQASTLAAQVVASAEALRAALGQQTEDARTNLTRQLEPIQKDIGDLRRVQYEAAGQKVQVSEAQAQGTASRSAVNLTLAVISVLMTLAFLGLAAAQYLAR